MPFMLIATAALSAIITYKTYKQSYSRLLKHYERKKAQAIQEKEKDEENH